MVDLSPMPKPDREQFERLLGPVHEAAFRFCLRLCTTRADAEDLYHDAILAAWNGLGGLKDTELFGPWFFQIVINFPQPGSTPALASVVALGGR